MSRRKRSFSKLKDERKCTCNNIEEQEDISYNINVNLEGKLDIQASPSCVGPGETINSGPHIACLIFFFSSVKLYFRVYLTSTSIMEWLFTPLLGVIFFN